MYDIDYSNYKKEKLVFRLFLYLGLLIMGISFAWGFLVYQSFAEFDGETLATNIEVNSYKDSEGKIMYNPIYHYSVDGNKYKCYSKISTTGSVDTNDKKVKYSTSNPEKCMSVYEIKSLPIVVLIIASVATVFLLVGLIPLTIINKKIKKIKYLANNGKLIKNLEYELENSNITVNNQPILRIAVNYKMPNGEVIKLHGEPRFDRKTSDSDGLVDLLIDENDPTNYYIDFEIKSNTATEDNTPTTI